MANFEGTQHLQSRPPRVVLDTNTLVASAYAGSSASRRIVEACLEGELVPVLSRALQKEYRHILGRAVRIHDFDRALERFMDLAVLVEPGETPRVVPDDPEDDKLVALALAAAADAIITNDRHLLTLDPHGNIRILRPVDFLRAWRENRIGPNGPIND